MRELAGALYDARDAAREVATAANPIEDAYRRVADGVHEGFVGAFESILRDGRVRFDDLGDGILSTFRRTLAEMATLAIAQPVIVPVVQQLGGLLGVSPAAQAGIATSLGGGLLGGGGGGLFGGGLGLVGRGIGTVFQGLSDGIGSLTGALNRFGAQFGFGLPASSLTASQTLALSGPLGGLAPGSAAGAQALGFSNAGALTTASFASIATAAAVAIPILFRLLRSRPRASGSLDLGDLDADIVVSGNRRGRGYQAAFEEVLSGIRDAVREAGGLTGTTVGLRARGSEIRLNVDRPGEDLDVSRTVEGAEELARALAEILDPLLEVRRAWGALVDGANPLGAAFEQIEAQFEEFRQNADILGVTLAEIARREGEAVADLQGALRDRLNVLAGRSGRPGQTVETVRRQFDPFRQAIAEGVDTGLSPADVDIAERDAVAAFVAGVRAELAELAGEAPTVTSELEALIRQFGFFRVNAEALGISIEEVDAAQAAATTRLLDAAFSAQEAELAAEAARRAADVDAIRTRLQRDVASARGGDPRQQALADLDAELEGLGAEGAAARGELASLVNELFALQAASEQAAAAAEAAAEARRRAAGVDALRTRLQRDLDVARGVDPLALALQDLDAQRPDLGAEGAAARTELQELVASILLLRTQSAEAAEAAAAQAEAERRAAQEAAAAAVEAERRAAGVEALRTRLQRDLDVARGVDPLVLALQDLDAELAGLGAEGGAAIEELTGLVIEIHNLRIASAEAAEAERRAAEAQRLAAVEAAAAERAAAEAAAEAARRAAGVDALRTRLQRDLDVARGVDPLTLALQDLDAELADLGAEGAAARTELAGLVSEVFGLRTAAAEAAEAAAAAAEAQRRAAGVDALRTRLQRDLDVARGVDPLTLALQDLDAELAGLGAEGAAARDELIDLVRQIHGLREAAAEAEAPDRNLERLAGVLDQLRADADPAGAALARLRSTFGELREAAGDLGVSSGELARLWRHQLNDLARSTRQTLSSLVDRAAAILGLPSLRDARDRIDADADEPFEVPIERFKRHGRSRPSCRAPK